MRTALATLAVAAVSCSFPALAQPGGTVAVINYAGFTGAFPLAPGSIGSAYGDFGNVAVTPLSSLAPMPRELSGVRLRIGGVEAPLYFVSRNQINFVVPAALTIGRHAVEVMSAGAVVAGGSVNIFDVGPALASSDATAARQGIVQNQDFSVNSQGAPARRGEIIQIYATGCGAVAPSVPDGTPPPGLARTVAPVRVFVSVEEAAVQFAGAHPQFPGICQINAIVPDRPFISGQVPLSFLVNGIESNAVSIWVQ